VEYACWRCSCSSLKWIEPRHRLQVTSCHPRTTRERRRLRVRRWPQAVCSRSVSHRWMGCSTADLPHLCQGLTGAGIAQTCPEPCCRGLCPAGGFLRVQRGSGARGRVPSQCGYCCEPSLCHALSPQYAPETICPNRINPGDGISIEPGNSSMAAWLSQELHLACALPVVLLTASTDTIRSCARPHEGQERSRAMAFAASHWAVSRAVACQLHSAARYSLASITASATWSR